MTRPLLALPLAAFAATSFACEGARDAVPAKEPEQVLPATDEARPQPSAQATASAAVSAVPVLSAEPLPSAAPAASAPPRATAPNAPPGPPPQLDPDGLSIQDLKLGKGPALGKGQTAVVHYTGTLETGAVFDSSLTRGEPFSFAVGKRHVIEGWERGVLGMRKGGVRRVVIPPALGYGSRAMATIPANSTLIFEIELLGIE